MASWIEEGRKAAESARAKFPEGCKVCVDWMDDPHPVQEGEIGTVVCVDDMGTVHCDFESGRRLGLIYGVDGFRRI